MLTLDEIKQLIRGIPPKTPIDVCSCYESEEGAINYALLKYPYLRHHCTGNHHVLNFIMMVYDDIVPQECPQYRIGCAALEDFPVPSQEAIVRAKEIWKDSDAKDYMVTAWCILGGYELPGLRYFKSHRRLADLVGITIDPRAIDYSCPIGDESLNTDPLLFEDPSLNNVFRVTMNGTYLEDNLGSFLNEYEGDYECENS